jgi:hypothetical protein
LTGLGDPPVRPDSAIARSLMDLEAMIGQLFPAILLSRLVGLHLSHRDKSFGDNPDRPVRPEKDIEATKIP